jgi:flavin reductase (DIM6/NTAB) family NADH-FMN oxidoreductase RutF
MGGDHAGTVTRDDLRSVLGHFPTGVVIVTAASGTGPVGMTLQSFMSLSLDPPLILLSVAKTSRSWPRIADSRRFMVNVLSGGQAELARRFAKSGTNKFAGVSFTQEEGTGGPMLKDIAAWIDCELDVQHDGGDHTIVVARVLAGGAGERIEHAHSPLIFHRSGFPSLAR